MKLKKLMTLILAAAVMFLTVPFAQAADTEEAFSEIEAALGDLSDVSGTVQLIREAQGTAVEWEISDETVIAPDGTVTALPTYADGPKKAVLTAKVNGEERSYNVRTATQAIPVIERLDAEEGTNGTSASYLSSTVFTNTDKRSGNMAYSTTARKVGSVTYGAAHTFSTNNITPAYPVTDDTKYIVTMYLKSLVSVSNAVTTIGIANPYTHKSEALSANGWSMAQGVSTLKNKTITNLFYGVNNLTGYLTDDYEIQLLAVGSVNISGENDVEIPLYGENARTVDLDYQILNQYGNTLGMVSWNTDTSRSWASQTATWSIVNPQSGVSIDEDGVLTVTSNAHRGSVTVRATVDKTDIPGSGWVYAEKTINLGSQLESLPQIRNLTLSGEVEVDETLSVSFSYYHIDNIAAGTSKIRWLRADKDESSLYQPIAGAVSASYTVTADDIGKCLKAEITPVDCNGVEGYPVYTEVTASKTAPQANNVKISYTGVVAVGSALNGEYTFYDINKDSQGMSLFRWLRADSENAVPVEISGADSANYVITSADLGKYLYFEVTPVSVAEPYTGTAQLSRKMLIPETEVAINIKNLTVNGIPAVGENLSCFYEYGNLDGKAEGKSILRQYISDTQNGEYTLIDAIYVNASNPAGLNLTADMENKWIMFELVPFDEEGNYGISAYTDAVQVMSLAEAEGIKTAISEISRAMGDTENAGSESEFLTSVSGGSVTWTSTDESVITSGGQVTVPDYSQGKKEVSMIAEISVGGVTVNKVFDLKTAVNGYVFAKYNAENKQNEETVSGFGKVTNQDSHGGSNSYLITPWGTNPYNGFNFTFSTGTVTAPFTITTETRYIVNAWVKRTTEETEVTPSFSNGVTDSAYNDNSTYAVYAEPWNSTEWVRLQTMGPVVRNKINNLFYGRNPRAFYADDVEAAVLSVGSINISGEDTIAVPLIGEENSSESYTYTMLNQYGTVFGMTEWNWTRGENSGTYPAQTASWQLAEAYEGVSVSENGDLTVTADAHAGEIKLRAYANQSDLPGSDWVYGEKVITLTAKAQSLPEARNVTALGLVEAGNTVTGSYEYYHINNSCEGATEIRWLRADEDKEELYTPITGAVSDEYVITDADAGKFLRFEVIPKDSRGNVGTTVRSNVITTRTAPAALDVKITVSGKVQVGAVLTGSYEYYDVNFDQQGATAFRWLRADTLGGIYSAIDGAAATTYTLTENDIDKYIKFEVSPVALAEPYAGTPVKSEAFSGPVKPAATNVTIKGSLVAGNTVTGDYTYSHAYGYEESGSTYEWYVNGVKAGTGITYTIKSGDAGRSIVFKVTPQCAAAPASGNAVSSAAYTVAASNVSQSTTITGGGNGGGGGGSTVSTNKPSSAVSENKPADNENISSETNNDNKSSYFSDTKNHWAFNEIEFMAEKGIAKGVGENLFDPDGKITRAEFVTLVLRTLELSESEYTGRYSDVSKDAWYAGYVETAAQYGIISDTASKFYPENEITRQEMSKIIVEAYRTDGNEIDLSKIPAFNDENMINTWAKGYVAAAAELNLIKGVGDNRFEPLRNATRAEAIVIIKRLYDLMYQ